MLWLNSFNFRKMIKNKWNFNPSPEKIDIALSIFLILLILPTDYMNVIFSGSIVIFLLVTINASLVSRGDTKSYRNVLIFSFFLNILLNPLFIYGFYLIPAMGISGIALATIVSELII